MNKKYTYLILLLVFASASAFVVISYKHKLKNKYVAIYPLKERNEKGVLQPEWIATKTQAESLIRVVRENPKDVKSSLALASLYIKEARITGNNMYYDGAAMNYINQVLEIEPENFEALTLKALIYLSQHHFSEALDIAHKAQKVGPYNAFVYGLLVDGNVEMGEYQAAVDAAEQMISLRPDVRSYSRISYLREIHGDNTGAIEAMQRAVTAGGSYGDEASSWTRIQLARLYENVGDLKSAEMHYTIALDKRPHYAYALAGLGHIAMANKDYTKAIAFYHQADSSVNDQDIKAQLASLYLLAGEQQKGTAIIKDVIKEMAADAEKGEEDEDIGHYADRELAYAYLMIKENNKALEHALAEYNRRPKNIDVNETVAWVYYKKGDVKKALPYITTALKTNCKNPTLLSRAGLIYAKNNEPGKAKSLLQEALKNNPNIDPDVKDEAINTLQSL